MAYQSVNPFTEQVIETFPDHTDAELAAILAAADAAYRSDWRLRSHADRAAVVRKAAALLRERVGHFAAIATREMGKLLREAKEEVLLSADILDYYADNAAAMLAPQSLPSPGARPWWKASRSASSSLSSRGTSHTTSWLGWPGRT